MFETLPATRPHAAMRAVSLALRILHNSRNETILQHPVSFVFIFVLLFKKHPCKMPHHSIDKQMFSK